MVETTTKNAIAVKSNFFIVWSLLFRTANVRNATFIADYTMKNRVSGKGLGKLIKNEDYRNNHQARMSICQLKLGICQIAGSHINIIFFLVALNSN